jgi:hypothetical protein
MEQKYFGLDERPHFGLDEPNIFSFTSNKVYISFSILIHKHEK